MKLRTFHPVLIIVVLFMGILFASTAMADTVTLFALDGARVDQDLPDSVNNTTDVQVFNGSGNDRWSYFKFDLSSIPDTAQISKAYFTWYNYGASWENNVENDRYIYFQHVADDNWSEASLTWNNKPTPGDLLGKAAPGLAGGWYKAYFIWEENSIDNWNEGQDLADDFLSVALLLKDDPYSALYVGYAQQLVIEYEVRPVPIPGAILLLGSGLLGIVGLRRKIKQSKPRRLQFDLFVL